MVWNSDLTSLHQVCCGCSLTLCTMRMWSKRIPSTSGSHAKTPPSSRAKAWPSSPSLPSSLGSARPSPSPTTVRPPATRRTAGNSDPGREWMFCGGFRRIWISKILLHKQKKARKKFFTWERLYYGSNFRSSYFFVNIILFWFFLFALQNVFFFLYIYIMRTQD